MNERKIITIVILGTSALIIFVVAIFLLIWYLRRRCKGRKRGTEQHSFTAERTVEDGITNPVLDEDRLVSETMQRVQEEQKQVSNDEGGMDARVEQMLHDAYADARKFAKFPNMA